MINAVPTKRYRRNLTSDPQLYTNCSRRIDYENIDETCILFSNVPIRQKSKVCVFEDDSTPTMVKRQQAMKKVMHVVFFRSMGLFKAIKLEGQKPVTAKN
ncbi:UNVERIFIED_CONTAM: hypothetical protein NCL1_12172 [Trichonephila clavipes]